MVSIEDIIDCGCDGDVGSPPSLVIQFVAGPKIVDALKDLGALMSSCLAWARYGDKAWSLFQVLQNRLVPSPLRLHPLLVSPEKSSARIAFLFSLFQINRYRQWYDGTEVSLVTPIAGSAEMWLTFRYRHCKTQVVLFDHDLEFFAALSLIGDPNKMISVVVGSSFKTTDLSNPFLRGRFHILSHERQSFDVSDGGLLAVHPPAFCKEETTLSVLQKLPTDQVVVGVNGILGRELAHVGTDSKNGQRAFVEWGRQHIVKNGPYLIFRSFCDALYPLQFCSPAFTGFDDRAREFAEHLDLMVGMSMIRLQEISMQHTESVSFVTIFISGVLGRDVVLVPLQE